MPNFLSHTIKKTFSLTIAVLFIFNSVSQAAPIERDGLRPLAAGQKDSTAEINKPIHRAVRDILRDIMSILATPAPDPSALQSQAAREIQEALNGPVIPVNFLQTDKTTPAMDYYERVSMILRILEGLQRLHPGTGFRNGYVVYRFTKSGSVIIQYKVPGAPDYIHVYSLDNKGRLVKTDQYNRAVGLISPLPDPEKAIRDFLKSKTTRRQRGPMDRRGSERVVISSLLGQLLGARDIPPGGGIKEKDWHGMSKHEVAQKIREMGLGEPCAAEIAKEIEGFARQIEADQINISADDGADTYKIMEDMGISLAALGVDAVCVLPEIKTCADEAYERLKGVLQRSPELRRETSVNKATHLIALLHSLITVYERLGPYAREEDIPASMFDIIESGININVPSWLGISPGQTAVNAAVSIGPAAVPGLYKLFSESGSSETGSSLKASVILTCARMGPAGTPVLIETLDDEEFSHMSIRHLIDAGKEMQEMAYVYYPEIISKLQDLAAGWEKRRKQAKGKAAESRITAWLSDINYLSARIEGFADKSFITDLIGALNIEGADERYKAQVAFLIGEIGPPRVASFEIMALERLRKKAKQPYYAEQLNIAIEKVRGQRRRVFSAPGTKGSIRLSSGADNTGFETVCIKGLTIRYYKGYRDYMDVWLSGEGQLAISGTLLSADYAPYANKLRCKFKELGDELSRIKKPLLDHMLSESTEGMTVEELRRRVASYNFKHVIPSTLVAFSWPGGYELKCYVVWVKINDLAFLVLFKGRGTGHDRHSGFRVCAVTELSSYDINRVARSLKIVPGSETFKKWSSLLVDNPFYSQKTAVGPKTASSGERLIRVDDFLFTCADRALSGRVLLNLGQSLKQRLNEAIPRLVERRQKIIEIDEPPRKDMKPQDADTWFIFPALRVGRAKPYFIIFIKIDEDTLLPILVRKLKSAPNRIDIITRIRKADIERLTDIARGQKQDDAQRLVLEVLNYFTRQQERSGAILSRSIFQQKPPADRQRSSSGGEVIRVGNLDIEVKEIKLKSLEDSGLRRSSAVSIIDGLAGLKKQAGKDKRYMSLSRGFIEPAFSNVSVAACVRIPGPNSGYLVLLRPDNKGFMYIPILVRIRGRNTLEAYLANLKAGQVGKINAALPKGAGLVEREVLIFFAEQLRQSTLLLFTDLRRLVDKRTHPPEDMVLTKKFLAAILSILKPGEPFVDDDITYLLTEGDELFVKSYTARPVSWSVYLLNVPGRLVVGKKGSGVIVEPDSLIQDVNQIIKNFLVLRRKARKNKPRPTSSSAGIKIEDFAELRAARSLGDMKIHGGVVDALQSLQRSVINAKGELEGYLQGRYLIRPGEVQGIKGPISLIGPFIYDGKIPVALMAIENPDGAHTLLAVSGGEDPAFYDVSIKSMADFGAIVSQVIDSSRFKDSPPFAPEAVPAWGSYLKRHAKDIPDTRINMEPSPLFAFEGSRYYLAMLEQTQPELYGQLLKLAKLIRLEPTAGVKIFKQYIRGELDRLDENTFRNKGLITGISPRDFMFSVEAKESGQVFFISGWSAISSPSQIGSRPLAFIVPDADRICAARSRPKSSSAGLTDCIELRDLDLEKDVIPGLGEELEVLRSSIIGQFKEFLQFQLSDILQWQHIADAIGNEELHLGRIRLVLGPFMYAEKKIFLMLVQGAKTHRIIALEPRGQDLCYLKMDIVDEAGFNRFTGGFIKGLVREQDIRPEAKGQLGLFGRRFALWKIIVKEQAAEFITTGLNIEDFAGFMKPLTDLVKLQMDKGLTKQLRAMRKIVARAKQKGFIPEKTISTLIELDRERWKNIIAVLGTFAYDNRKLCLLLVKDKTPRPVGYIYRLMAIGNEETPSLYSVSYVKNIPMLEAIIDQRIASGSMPHEAVLACKKYLERNRGGISDIDIDAEAFTAKVYKETKTYLKMMKRNQQAVVHEIGCILSRFASRFKSRHLKPEHLQELIETTGLTNIRLGVFSFRDIWNNGRILRFDMPRVFIIETRDSGQRFLISFDYPIFDLSRDELSRFPFGGRAAVIKDITPKLSSVTSTSLADIKSLQQIDHSA